MEARLALNWGRIMIGWSLDNSIDTELKVTIAPIYLMGIGAYPIIIQDKIDGFDIT